MKVQFGCAPINWTNDDLPSLGGELTYQQCLSEMALADRSTHRPEKADHRWFSSFFTTFENDRTYDAFEKHMDFTYGLGARVIGVGECGVTVHGQEETPLFPNSPVLTEEQMKNLAEGLNELGRRAQKKGMKVGFHPHVGTGIQSLEEIDRLMELTDPTLVGLLFDTGHSTIAGEDPVAILKKYIDRVVHIHVKDVRREVFEQVKAGNHSFLWGVKNGMYTVPGDGSCVDWDAIFSILRGSDYEGWIVVEAEQDPAKADPLEYAQKARAFMREQLGV